MPFNLRKVAGVLVFVAAAQFTVGLMVAAALTPGYSIADDTISALGVREGSLVFNASVILLGGLVVATAYVLHRVDAALSVTVPLLLTGVGAVGVGLFPSGVEPFHLLFSTLAFVAAGVAAILVARVLLSPFRVLSVILGVAALAALVLFATGTYLALGRGGMERMIVLPVLAWGMALGGYLMGAPETPARRAG